MPTLVIFVNSANQLELKTGLCMQSMLHGYLQRSCFDPDTTPFILVTAEQKLSITMIMRYIEHILLDAHRQQQSLNEPPPLKHVYQKLITMQQHQKLKIEYFH